MLCRKNHKLFLNLLLVGLFLFNFSKTIAQPIILNPVSVSYFQPKFGINTGILFNHEDFLFDLGLGLEEIGYNFSATLNGSFRPYYKTVLSKESDHLYWQLKERVTQFSIDLEKRFFFLEFENRSKIGVYALLKAGYFYGKYKGLSKKRNNEFTVNPGGGITLQFSKMSRLSIGYLYLNQNPYAHPHTFNLKFSIYTHKNNNQ